MGDTRRLKLPVIPVLAALALGFAAPASASFTARSPAPPNAALAAASSLTASVETLTSSFDARLSWSPTPPGPRPYFGARYYGSRIGRFTTVDPFCSIRESLSDPQRWNRYAYARNNPFRYVDPDGRAAVEVPAGAQALFPIAASVRGAVGDLFMMGNANQPATYFVVGTIVDATLAAVLPKDQAEYKANAEAALFGMAASLEAGPNILANRLAGRAAEAKIAAEVAEEGGRVPAVRCVVGHLSGVG